MKKILFLFISLLFCVSVFSQQNESQSDIYKPVIIIGVGQSDNLEIFNEIKDYVKICKKDLSVVFICEQHRVIVFETNSERYKDPTTLVATLEKIFINTDFCIKNDDDIIKNDCKDEYEKYKINK